MNLKEFLDQIQASCKFLETENYILRKVDTSVNRNFWYEKTTADGEYQISFSWTQYGDNFHVNGTQALKRFNEVETILHSILGGELNDYHTIHQTPFVDYIPKTLGYDTTENNIHFILNTPDDILLFCDFLKFFYYKTANPFFEKYRILSSVNTWLQNNDIEKHQDILAVSNNTMMLRKLVIMKNSRDEGYENLFGRYKKFLNQKYTENESPYVDMYSVFLKLENYLLNHS